MTDDLTPQLIWSHKPFGRRLVTSGHPYFSISSPSSSEHGDARRRSELADLAGL